MVEALTPQPRSEPTPIRPKVAGEGSRYGLAALDAETRRAAAAPTGTRNDTLNLAAFALGQLQAGGELPLGLVGRGEGGIRLSGLVESELLHAAGTCGLPDLEARKTIASGLLAGRQRPRQAA